LGIGGKFRYAFDVSDSAPSSGVLLRVRNARVRFGRTVAVNDVSLDLRGGELLGLIGPNGAGKTTLLRACAGIQPLTGGQIHILDEILESGACPILRHVGFTPDTPAVYEQLTVRQFLEFISRGYDLSHSEMNERIDFWLEKVWLSEKADQRIKSLSRGMRQRVGIARTLIPNPAIILLDEPAAGLDPAGRVQFRQLLTDLREQGKALIVSSHILSDMNQFCSHIAIMAAGRIVQYGTVSQIAEATNGQRCRYALVLAEPIAGIEQIFAELAGISAARFDSDRVTFEYSADRAAAAELLEKLVARRVRVASFAPLAAGLEEAYLRSGIRQVD
jgi:ABC-2 type transport system ATP-binding protein